MSNTGGTAFPSTTWDNEFETATEQSNGMTLRDYFAAKALQSLIMGQVIRSAAGNKVLAKYAYEFADAMITERE